MSNMSHSLDKENEELIGGKCQSQKNKYVELITNILVYANTIFNR